MEDKKAALEINKKIERKLDNQRIVVDKANIRIQDIVKNDAKIKQA